MQIENRKLNHLRNKDLSKSRSTPLEAILSLKEKKLNYKSTRRAIKNDDGNR